ncbi:14171_t:CDS:10, partial [Funneliformis geosporum]
MTSRTLKVFVFFLSIFSLILSESTFAYTREPTEDRNNKLKHDYKLTFKKPYYYNHTIPFFDTYGRSIWAQLPNPHKEWEVELSFQITGKFYVGGRGIAFWYTKDRAEQGPVFGNKDEWVGLVIMFETVDHSRKREHPIIMAHLNDGSKLYNNITEPRDAMLAGCYRLFHNTPSPVFARISYYNRTIKLEVDANDEGGAYLPCFEQKDIDLPTGYYFGVSAIAEGETPDDHDVLSFETYEINPVEKQNRQLRPHEAEKVKNVPAENYEIPTDVKKRIEDIKKVVSSPKEDSKDREDSRNVDFIRGMQTKILESIDRLHDVLQTSGGANSYAKYYTGESSKTESQLEAISQKLDRVITSLTSLENRVSRIPISSNEYAIKELKGDMQRIIGKIDAMDGRIAGQFHQTQRSFQE